MKSAYFIEHDGHELFALYDAPLEDRDQREGVLICPPAPYEMRRAHRALRGLSQSLAKKGYHVLRLDYRGTGDSSGKTEDWSLTAWLSDIQRACEELKTKYQVERLTIIGLRLGASLAYQASREQAVKRLILWDAIYSGAEYLKDLKACHREFCEREEDRPPYQKPDPRPQLLGYELTSQWQTELESFGLQLNEGGRGLLLETKGVSESLKPGLFRVLKIDEALKWNDPLALQLQTYAHISIKTIENAMEGKA